MTLQTTNQMPLALPAAPKTEVRTQFGALCYRMRSGKPEVLLVTSRGSGRWIIPKGWPIPGLTPAEMSLQEAWEEAGVRGVAHNLALGLYSYTKEIGLERGLPCLVMVYPVRVTSLSAHFPEAGQRRHKWMRPKKAAKRVDETELAHLISGFEPRKLGL
ncbi:NUDIX hydrolase [uncultured Roseovarius sp.]|uniref:NUDIX hydrolase n=1 Tax=uncultured Roseovarius sp. TaxID=293344 RepID=UPI002628A5A7|nr:NUDIX hydrolase [uncultured Roseovarius sp.]